MSLAVTVAGLAASQAARRAAASAGAGFVASRAVGAGASRFVQSDPVASAALDVAETAVGQELTTGDVPGATGAASVGSSLGDLF